MKRYLVFAGCTYYAAGGMNDFIGDFESIPTLNFVDDYKCELNGKIILSTQEHDEGEPETIEWYQIYDTHTRERIQCGEIHN